jgi:hemerythrin-like domain-containing protein
VSATSSPSPPPEALLERWFMARHDGLEQAFHAHQVALLDRDFARALAALRDYAAALVAHMREEESLILPRYAALGGDGTDAPTKLFLGEHEKMRAFVAECTRRTDALLASPDDRALLDLLDREATYKNLVLHHDLRERNGLYPFLSQRLSAAEQREVVDAAARLAGLR